MGTRLKIALAVVVLGLGLAVYCVMPREPSYQGQTVSEWLTQCDSLVGRNAISNIGAAALPYIISELEVKDPAWKTKLIEWWNKQGLIQFKFTTDRVRRYRAIRACQALGPLAKPAIPALGTALSYGSSEAIQALEKFGAEAIPALTRGIMSTNPPLCGLPYGTALTLKKFGAKAKGAVPQLIWAFENQPIGFPRTASASALAAIYCDLTTNGVSCEEARLAKAALLRGLQNPKLSLPAIRALGEMGPLAMDAAPLIDKQLASLIGYDRELTLVALRSITRDYARYPLSTNTQQANVEILE